MLKRETKMVQPESADSMVIKMGLSNPMLTLPSSMVVYRDGKVERSRDGKWDSFKVDPDIVSKVVNEATRNGFFRIEESAIRRGMDEVDVGKSRRGEMYGRGLNDGTLVSLSMYSGHRSNTVTFCGVEEFYQRYPTVEDLRVLRECVVMVKSNFWAKRPHFWEEVPR
jgi:hypothetical protein